MKPVIEIVENEYVKPGLLPQVAVRKGAGPSGEINNNSCTLPLVTRAFA
jgi:hypothetical protein